MSRQGYLDCPPITLVIPTTHRGARTIEQEAKVLHFTGYSSRQLMRQGAPIRVRGTGTGKRRILLISEFIDWLKTTTRLEQL